MLSSIAARRGAYKLDRMMKRYTWPLFALLFCVALPATAADEPSRKPVKGCAWEQLLDAKLGLQAWVQRCDFGFRTIDFQVVKNSLEIHYSDGGGALYPVVD